MKGYFSISSTFALTNLKLNILYTFTVCTHKFSFIIMDNTTKQTEITEYCLKSTIYII